MRTVEGRQTNYERTIEAAYATDDVVVIVGKERLVWEGTSLEDLDGRRTARRFTNVWKLVDGQWRQIAHRPDRASRRLR